jgi:tRNA dimethylallyltransferase
VELAVRFNGEIINGDAMQMYEGLPIITNKITMEEQQGIPHHLLGSIPLNEDPWAVGLFKKKATHVIQEIRSRGRLPILVGGTHYYTQSLLFDETLVETDIAESTEAITSESHNYEKYPILDGTTEAMINRLREVDPVMADRWHPNDKRKIRRSLEIFLTTGKRASEIYAEQQQRKTVGNTTVVEIAGSTGQSVTESSVLLFWAYSDPQILKDRLNARIDKMVTMGLLDEVIAMNEFHKQQNAAGNIIDITKGIWVSIGYKEFGEYLGALKSNERCPNESKRLYDLSIEKIQFATRQYAKRQVRWIRIKLLNALSEAGLRERLYLVDTSDVAKWNEHVSTPTIDITEKFLNAGGMPLPSEVSTIAGQVLSPDDRTEEVQEVGNRQECQLCHVITVTEQQWRAHLGSRRHRALNKKRLKNIANCRSPPEAVPSI